MQLDELWKFYDFPYKKKLPCSKPSRLVLGGRGRKPQTPSVVRGRDGAKMGGKRAKKGMIEPRIELGTFSVLD